MIKENMLDIEIKNKLYKKLENKWFKNTSIKNQKDFYIRLIDFVMFWNFTNKTKNINILFDRCEFILALKRQGMLNITI